MQTYEHTWSLQRGSLGPLRVLGYTMWLGEELSVFLQGRWPDVRNLHLPHKCPLHWVIDKFHQVTCSVRSCPNLLLDLAHCSCFCPSQCPLGEPLQLSYNKTEHIHLFLPNLLCGQSFLLWCWCTSLLTFFFFVASHDPWQTQLPPWWWCVCQQPAPWNSPVLLTDTFVCSPKTSPCDMVAVYAPQKFAGASILCCSCDQC